MDDPNQQPGAKTPDQTGNTPPATDPQGKPSATVDNGQFQVPEGYKLIKEEDHKKVISSRDKSNNDLKEVKGQVFELQQKEAIRTAMATSEFKEKYPDVSFDDIVAGFPQSEEEIVSIAKAMQERFEKVKLDHVAKVQRVVTPTISAEDKEAKLEELKKPSRMSRFQQALKIDRMKVT